MAGLKEAVRTLLACPDGAIRFFTRRDVCCTEAGDVVDLWDLPGAVRILRKQQRDGSWLFPGVENAFRWLLFIRQDDGGWAIPARTRGVSLYHSFLHCRLPAYERPKLLNGYDRGSARTGCSTSICCATEACRT